jgi:hypothetical protein
VSCSVCHSITATTGTSNGAYVLDSRRATQPLPASRHAPGYSNSLLAEPELCATCHEASNPDSGLAVMTTYSEWAGSPYNSSVTAQRKTCQDCHFAAGQHGALRPDDLRNAATVQISGPAVATAGAETTLTVRVSNSGAGHDLPTGEVEMRLLWLDVRVTDATGRVIFASGRIDEFGQPQDGTVVYGTTWRDRDGQPTLRMWEAGAVLKDQRIPAQGAAVETFKVSVPAGVRGPLQVHVALKYQTSSTYLVSLMTTYTGRQIAPPAVIEMAAADGAITVRGQ